MSIKYSSFALLGVSVLLIGGVGAWWSTLPRSDAQAAAAALPVIEQPAPAGAADGAVDTGVSQQGGGQSATDDPGAAGTPAATDPGASGSSGSQRGGSTVTTSAPLMPATLVSTSWLATTAAKTGIPRRALQAYAGASIVSETRNPGCNLGWNTLAGIGEEESGQGTSGGAHIGPNGDVVGSIVGQLITQGPAAGQRALGPMQIIPSTWAQYAVDADGTGQASPNNIDDAALAAADYLCVAGGDLSTGAGWTAAVHAYNPDDSYVAAVRADANQYARLAAG